MPRGKEFDIDNAIDRAQRVFWMKGYEATSMSDLTEAMGINKGSLYNAFGSKKELFTQTLLKYDRENRQQALEQLETIEDPHVAVTTLFDSLIAESMSDTERKGCLLVNTALELPNHGDEVRQMVSSALGDFEGFFKRLISRGHKLGTIPKRAKAGDTSKSLLSMVVGLRVLARGVFDAADLRAIKRDALRLISE